MPTNQPPNSVQLSGRLLDQLEQYAQQHGLTPDQAATQLASQELRVRYARNRQPAPVVPLRRNK